MKKLIFDGGRMQQRQVNAVLDARWRVVFHAHFGYAQRVLLDCYSAFCISGPLLTRASK